MARGDGIHRTSARNARMKDTDIDNAQAHNEREKSSYVNQDIVPERTPYNVHFKTPTAGYKEMFEQMRSDGVISTRGLKADAEKFGELIFDVNSAYFFNHGGYEFAKQYFKAISPSEIQIGKEYMCSIIEYTCPRNPTYSIGYVMKCGSVSADLIKSGNSFCANKKVSWKDTEGYKKAFIEKSEAETIFGRSVFCYFGPDRYEKPAWMGKRYYQQDEDIHPSIRERWQGQLRKPITVHDVNEQTLQWLLDIIADSRCDIVQKGDQCPMVIVFPPRRFRSFRKHMPFILQRRSIKQKSKMQSIRIQQNHLS